MALSEFSLIKAYFSSYDKGENIVLGIGDDCALVRPVDGYELAITTDTMNKGIHFFAHLDPYFLGYKSLVVNLSDLAAMGARPDFFTLSLTLENAEESFLEPFSKGLFDCAKKEGIKLVGGNTSKGPLSVTISAFGQVKKGKALLRSKARAGDLILVTGTLGLPGFYVDAVYNKQIQNKAELLKLETLTQIKKVNCSFMHELAELNLCQCAIDISDGLAGDLKHILESSGCSAHLRLESLPCHPMLYDYELAYDKLCDYALFGGCDYEVLFTCTEENLDRIYSIAEAYDTKLSLIGEVTAGMEEGLVCTLNGQNRELLHKPFEHF